jgi:glucosamine-phosphate N-acetyltransferase
MFRDLNENDIGYLDLLEYKYSWNFKKDPKRIIKVVEQDGKLVGAGTLFILEKLHCNPIGQIEDVVVSEEYRGQGYGKRIVSHLVEIAKNFGCYKIILNSHYHNVDFYIKCGFTKEGVQMVLRNC